MKVTVRRIGNSLGVIIPRAVLKAWRIGEGDYLSVGDEGIRPPAPAASTHDTLDELKRRLAAAVAAHYPAQEIRAHSLANLHRWNSDNVWVSAYDEWKQILVSGDDGKLFATMLGRDENSTRLRQSPPYVGLLPRQQVERLNEEASR